MKENILSLKKISMPPSKMGELLLDGFITVIKDSMSSADTLEIDFDDDGYFGCSHHSAFNPPLKPREYVATDYDSFTPSGPIPDVYLAFFDKKREKIYVVDLTIK